MGMAAAPARSGLLRILGLGFGLAVVVGNTVGIGILRTPGDVASLLRDPRLIFGIWLLGGVYALLGSLSVAELGTMLPQAGGFYVYARRAFGDGVGLMVGTSDWIGQCAAIAYATVAFGEYLGFLAPPLAGREAAVACAVILAFALLHWTGLRASSRALEWTTVLKAVAFAAFIAACFRAPASPPAAALPPHGLALLAAYFLALQSVVVTYDGWYASIYFAEEDRDPARNVPRSMIGATLAIIAVYLLMNAVYLRVLGAQALAGSKQPAADAIARLAGASAGRLVTLLSIVSLLPLINAILLVGARILFGLSRDGLAPSRLAGVSARGTPVAMWATAALASLFAATGAFSRLLAVGGFLFVVNHCASFVSLLILRRREPAAPRPFRTPLYPWLTLAALGGGISYLAGALLDDPANSLFALAVVAAGYPAFRLARRLLRT
jgi:APA family basic amino acid/polyamine antiporter